VAQRTLAPVVAAVVGASVLAGSLLTVLQAVGGLFFPSSGSIGGPVVGALICAGLTLRLQAMLADTPDRAWWPVLSAIFSLLVLPLWLAVCGVVRNLLVFRSGQGSR
jgi:hypothetical protein